MCGINGIWNLDGSLVPKGKILSMNQNLKHRGPDENNIIIEKKLALGHTRLSIIDVDNGKQPISNADKSISMVYNGEIYNMPFISPGYSFADSNGYGEINIDYSDFANDTLMVTGFIDDGYGNEVYDYLYIITTILTDGTHE